MATPLEGFYPLLPVWMQNAGISLYGLLWRRERMGGQFQQFVRGFQDRDRLSRPAAERYLQQELSRTLQLAFAEVPYYRNTWTAAGLDAARVAALTPERLGELPITSKRQLRLSPESLVTASAQRRGATHRYYSSGSTGTPVTMICEPEDHQRFIAAREVRSFQWAGSSIHHSRSTIGGRMVTPKALAKPPFHRYNWAEKQIYSSAYHISPASVKDYVGAFDRHRPLLFTGYAYSHFLLARMMNERGLRLSYQPEAAVLSSEKLTPEIKAQIQQAFRARAYEEYGAVENCMLATECSHGSLHVSPDFGIVEIVDDAGQPCAPGVPGRVLCTGLVNRSQLLIRYEIGDIATWAGRGCACGRDHLPVIEEIVGRLEDVVVGPDGREMVRFHGLFIDLAGVMEGQVVQEDVDRLLLNVVVSDAFGPAQEELLRQRVHQRLGPVKVEIRRLDAIPRTERGKFRAVISKVKRTEFRDQAVR